MGGGAIIPNLGDFRNDTFGRYFDNNMGCENMVHYWHFKKEIGSLDAYVNFWWPSRFFLQNRDNHKFLSLTSELILSRIRNFRRSDEPNE